MDMPRQDVLQKRVISPLVAKCSIQIVYVKARVDEQPFASRDFYAKATGDEPYCAETFQIDKKRTVIQRALIIDKLV